MLIMQRMMKMNLKEGKGLVPIQTNDKLSPYRLVEFPDRDTFNELFHKSIPPATLSKFWDILKCRAGGSTLADAGKAYGLSRERIRQIEAKFIRRVGHHHASKTSSSSDLS